MCYLRIFFIATVYVVGYVLMKYGASLILTGENRNTLRKAYPSTSFSTRFSTRTVLRSNSTSAARDWRPTVWTRSPRSIIDEWAPEPRQGLHSCQYNNKTVIQWINHLFVRCYKLKFLKCLVSPRSKSVFSRQILECALQNTILTASVDCTMAYTVGIHRHVFGYTLCSDIFMFCWPCIMV